MARALRGRDGRLTVSDAATLAGMPLDRARRTLDRMLSVYRSHLAATESGELLYSFGSRLQRRDAEPLRARLARVGDAMWRLFVLLFKLAIVAVLAVYFLAFVALLLGLVVASFSRDGDRDDGDGPFPLWILLWILPWDTGAPATTRRRPRRRRRRAKGVKVHQQVFNFVFGPPRAAGEGDDREILDYLREHQGRLCAADLVALQGIDLVQAEQEATRLMCDYDGEPEVTDEGVVLYVFRELRRSAMSASSGSRRRYAWDRLEDRPRLTGNSSTADLVIGLVNGFNLLAPLWLAPAAVARLGLPRTAAETWLEIVPLVFSVTFFAVPLARAAVRAAREPARRRRNRRRRLLREIFGGSAGPTIAVADAVDLARVCRVLAPSDPAERTALRREADGLVLQLDGDIVLEGGGDQVTFPRLSSELAAVRAARVRSSRDEVTAGAVVFDSARAMEASPEMGSAPKA